MREDLVTIASRLRDLGVPDPIVELHCRRVEKYRKQHPVRIKRKRLRDIEPPPLSSYRTHVAFR